ncbi:di-heme oxidoredictase family protein [Anaeromyxobacter oryzae]|uniref:di-heme oxidoredictase family protein n=1 Tax=Anaeromyxobacter oryzae TaxID=2918170 RepID=UPI0020BD65AA|nr:di-heme oxidoredictase family protein [Anaeromyxobacter oryzae]
MRAPLRALVVLLAMPLAPAAAGSNHDTGIRAAAQGIGDPLPGLTAEELAFFQAGLQDFVVRASVQGDAVIPGTESGLGPRFNLDSCAGCHAQPAAGGTSPAVNPQVAMASAAGATNRVPWFVAPDGPIREARYVARPDGSRDGSVVQMYVITGRTDAPGCSLRQPDYGAAGDPVTGQGGDPNVIFRIPTPVFGGGLIEAIPDQAILDNMRARAFAKMLLGISGHPNVSGNDGSITRFGWKAQNKSLLMFAGEAYNVEQGVTNALFGNEREEDPGCAFNPLPEDFASFVTDPGTAHAGITKFAAFMRFLAPPAPAPDTPAIVRGRAVFASTGCVLCHTPTLRTGKARTAALSEQPVSLYSDLLVHDMGVGLADGVSQGTAGPREFRTAPLWGLGYRIFLLHDGRTRDLGDAIEAHASPGSEANVVVRRYRQLGSDDRQALVAFLRSL